MNEYDTQSAPNVRERKVSELNANRELALEQAARKVGQVAASGPVPVPAPSAVALSNDPTIKAMQASIRAGKVREFTYEQVLGWEAAGEEQFGSDTYQTGLVDYKSDTIFGVKTIHAKALLKNGVVVKWVWPTSGMEIR